MVTHRSYSQETADSPQTTLPTMYDLPSEDPNEPGLPDEFHDIQPQLLSRTLRVAEYSADQIFCGSDLNLYYDPATNGYKRPDWFTVLGVPRLYEGEDMRSSYVIWQEKVVPAVVVELLSGGTERDDLGPYAESATTGKALLPKPTPLSADNAPPSKWQVYENVLKIPNYVVYSRFTHRLRYFRHLDGRLREQPLSQTNPLLWIPEIKLGLGFWSGEFEGVERLWLRWCDEDGNWVPTDTEQERQRAESAEAQLAEERRQREQLLAKLREQGIDPDELLRE
ncbi:MAG: Uma2 family endonuclease [Cyanobacteria bacterium P01_A01_bin.114]